jgi:carbon storage regulator CsrA
MLVLTRKAGEKIVIADGITIAVSQIGKNRVRLTIDAPPNVRVSRSEIPQSAHPNPSSSEAIPCAPATVGAT